MWKEGQQSFLFVYPCPVSLPSPSSNPTRELFLKKCDLPWLKNLRSEGENQQPNSNSTYYGGPGSGTRTERYWLKASAVTPLSPLLPQSEHKNETVLRERETCSSSQRKELHWSFRRIVCQLWNLWELKLWTCITCHMILVINRKITPREMFFIHCLLLRTQRSLSLYENVRAKDGGKEKTGETVLRLSFFSLIPCALSPVTLVLCLPLYKEQSVWGRRGSTLQVKFSERFTLHSYSISPFGQATREWLVKKDARVRGFAYGFVVN